MHGWIIVDKPLGLGSTQVVSAVKRALRQGGYGKFKVGHGGTQPDGAARFVFANLVNFLQVNVFLAIFNLLPMPPFDGGHVVEGLLPRPLAAQWARIGRFGFVLLLLVLVVLPMLVPGADVVGRIVGPPAEAVLGVFLRLAGVLA